MSIGRLSGVVIQAGVVLWMVSPSIPAAMPVIDVYGGQATITIVGQAGTFGPPKREVTPSGQRLGRLAAPEWAFPAARKPGASVLASDGTLLMPAVSHNDSLTVPTSPEMSVDGTAAGMDGLTIHRTTPAWTTTALSRPILTLASPVGLVTSFARERDGHRHHAISP